VSETKIEVQNNPAGRLHQLLADAKQQEPNQSARDAWAKVFATEPGDTEAMLRMLSDLIALVRETEAAILRLDDVDHDLYLKPFKRIRSLLSQVHLDNAWEHWRNQIDETMLVGLRFSADKLSRISGITAIDTDELGDIREQIDLLFNQVTDSELDPALKIALLHNLSALRVAIAAFRIQGVEGLEQEIERSIGSIILRKEQIKAAGPPEKDAWTAFFGLVERLNKVVTFARNAKALAAPAVLKLAQLLGP
jgi:hypothetical protein